MNVGRAIETERRAEIKDATPPEVPAGCENTLLADRTIRHWIARHEHLPVALLITMLVAALDAARSQGRGLVLPELPAAVSGAVETAMNAPPRSLAPA